MNLVLTTVKYSSNKLTQQIYDKHIILFGPMTIDFRIKEMIRCQKRQDQQVEKDIKAKEAAVLAETAAQVKKEAKAKKKLQQEQQLLSPSEQKSLNINEALKVAIDNIEDCKESSPSPRGAPSPQERNAAEKILYDDIAKKLK